MNSILGLTGVNACKQCGDKARKERNRLTAENAELREQNTKLRELTRYMRTCIEHACMCDFCPLFLAEDMDETRCIADIDSRMRELEVKVPS